MLERFENWAFPPSNIEPQIAETIEGIKPEKLEVIRIAETIKHSQARLELMQLYQKYDDILAKNQDVNRLLNQTLDDYLEVGYELITQNESFVQALQLDISTIELQQSSRQIRGVKASILQSVTYISELATYQPTPNSVPRALARGLISMLSGKKI